MLTNFLKIQALKFVRKYLKKSVFNFQAFYSKTIILLCEHKKKINTVFLIFLNCYMNNIL